MKKKIIFLPLLLTLVVACTTTSTSEENSQLPTTSEQQSTSADPSLSENATSHDSYISEEISTSEEITTSELPTSEPSIPPSSEAEIVYQNISEIRELALGLASKTNERKVATSTLKVEFRAQLLFYQDYVAGGGDYTYRNKALVANETGYILVSMDAVSYDLNKNYESQQQVYDFKGTISLYNTEPEVTLTQRPTYIKDLTLNYTLPAVEETSINDVFTEIKQTAVNNKGIGYKVEVKEMTLQYLMKLENSIGLFSDGTNVIQIHGHGKVNSNWQVESVYKIKFIAGFHLYKTQFKYISQTTSTATIDDLEVDQMMKASDLYSYTYVQDPKFAADKVKNLEYSELFINVYVFEGYVNYYMKDGRGNISFDDSAKGPYSAYTNAVTAKSMFINNESGLKLDTYKDLENCIFLDQAIAAPDDKILIEMIFTPYVRNTNGYFQIHVFEGSYQPGA